MRFSCDRTGFPLVTVAEGRIQAHLLPVTKVQCERFLAEPNAFDDTWYEGVLALNPRLSVHRLTNETREQAFLTGLLAEEALAFARWLGDGFDLPTIEEWRMLCRELEHQPVPGLMGADMTPACAVLLERLKVQLRPRSLLDLSLLRGGVVEWVRKGKDCLGLGAPRQEFHPNLWDPLTDEVRPLRPQERVPFFGCRLVRRLS